MLMPAPRPISNSPAFSSEWLNDLRGLSWYDARSMAGILHIAQSKALRVCYWFSPILTNEHDSNMLHLEFDDNLIVKGSRLT